MKIGVLGGTFDPIHRAHLTIAACALDEYSLDEVWFMPAGDPYFKEGSSVTAPGIRLAMTEKCIEAFGEPRFKCSDFEIRDRHRTYTSQTFRRLGEACPDDRFFFIMGLDSLESLHSWYKPEELFRCAVILCALRQKERSGNETFFHKDEETMLSGMTGEDEDERRFRRAVSFLKERFPDAAPDIRRLHCPEIAMSSTLIREKAKAGEDILTFVTPAVARFIREHGLYGT